MLKPKPKVNIKDYSARKRFFNSNWSRFFCERGQRKDWRSDFIEWAKDNDFTDKEIFGI